MGATRALITIKRGDTTIYVNDRALAADYLAKITPAEGGTPGGDEVDTRAELQRAALDAHQALNQLNKQPSHNLGLATAQAWERLTGAERKALVSVRKKSNAARHNWQKAQEDSDTSGGTADTQRVTVPVPTDGRERSEHGWVPPEPSHGGDEAGQPHRTDVESSAVEKVNHVEALAHCAAVRCDASVDAIPTVQQMRHLRIPKCKCSQRRKR